jgi:dihydrodipicolinate reductase
MTNIIITGSKGRMGRALVSCVARHPDLQLVARLIRATICGR